VSNNTNIDLSNLSTNTLLLINGRWWSYESHEHDTVFVLDKDGAEQAFFITDIDDITG
jgi:hypothetical protein